MRANDVTDKFCRGIKYFRGVFQTVLFRGTKYFDIFGPGRTKIGGPNFS